jgi:hypothetical protein
MKFRMERAFDAGQRLNPASDGALAGVVVVLLLLARLRCCIAWIDPLFFVRLESWPFLASLQSGKIPYAAAPCNW